uniref:Uncharacterized protein n=1 Tax=uncultured marine virus TaxID=186617 RepID=A0A0F7LB46_9VIRU|nr:hypothetical protein [uncultured marine virus]
MPFFPVCCDNKLIFLLYCCEYDVDIFFIYIFFPIFLFELVQSHLFYILIHDQCRKHLFLQLKHICIF